MIGESETLSTALNNLEKRQKSLNAELDAVKEFSENLKKIGKSSLGEKVLKAGQGEKFNQKFDNFHNLFIFKTNSELEDDFNENWSLIDGQKVSFMQSKK